MPPLDVGSLVLCDSGAESEASSSCGCDETALPSSTDGYDPYDDAPAESLRLRIGEDIDWSDVVVGAVAAAAVLERDDSTKGAAANPKSCAARRSAATAARSSLSTTPAPPAPRTAVAVVIGGLPTATRDHGGRRRSPCRPQLQLGGRAARVFASSGEAAGGHHQSEPGSPKVSCLGGVRSQPRTAAEGERITSGGRRWWAWLVADVMFCCCWNGRRHRRPTASQAE
ncbi:hypothetical protein BDA96_04G178000 [Sorghum bicolor]|uniref:Uncharacterized protein n=2 Tax=Sorghum bicolor TaxID=4558 RepID=A0A921R3F6_SORBI|nr:uncharacterized protein LOC8058649 [Sorghum bicolor]EES05185.1 hypothetical protein SORBI_3004G166200 [Sorghum bicolor]KAG0533264.1 hypothetical protein BDA96_04G178000 [Sorghum bicolor]|eukprot:XP_002452209.1 uncharacterized protein LOC8058649 [Sorghum bicolor]